MKKVLSFCAAIIMGLCLFCGCRLYDGDFLNKEHFENCLIPDLPLPKAKIIEDNGDSATFDITEEGFREYVKEVYDYIIACNFQILGTVKQGEGGPSQEAKRCTELEEFKSDKYNLDGYLFIWYDKIKAEATEGSHRPMHNLLVAYNSTDSNMLLELCNTGFVSFYFPDEEN